MKLLRVNGDLLPTKPLALIDSGADCTSFPLDMMEAMGIDIEDCVELEGLTAGGTTRQYRYEPGVDVIFDGKKIHLEAVFNEGLGLILLGRSDFFDLYKVTFDQRRERFFLEEYGAPEHGGTEEFPEIAIPTAA